MWIKLCLHGYCHEGLDAFENVRNSYSKPLCWRGISFWLRNYYFRKKIAPDNVSVLWCIIFRQSFLSGRIVLLPDRDPDWLQGQRPKVSETLLH